MVKQIVLLRKDIFFIGISCFLVFFFSLDVVDIYNMKNVKLKGDGGYAWVG